MSFANIARILAMYHQVIKGERKNEKETRPHIHSLLLAPLPLSATSASSPNPPPPQPCETGPSRAWGRLNTANQSTDALPAAPCYRDLKSQERNLSKAPSQLAAATLQPHSDLISFIRLVEAAILILASRLFPTILYLCSSKLQPFLPTQTCPTPHSGRLQPNCP